MKEQNIHPTEQGPCCDNQLAPGKCGSGHLSRRAFIRLAAVGTAGVALDNIVLPVMAGPFEKNEYLKIIPTDKKLDADWVRSLFARGQKQMYSDPKALENIGMPIGGLFAGTVYLSGDGRLWLWDIFNRDQEGIVPRQISYKGTSIGTRSGANYIEPAKQSDPFEQDFTLRIRSRDIDKEIPLNKEGFNHVTFKGQYPQAVVNYHSDDLPITVRLEAFSPFIPLNVEDSSLPATLMNYTIENTSDKSVEVDIIGRLQNPICYQTRIQTTGRLVNHIVRKKNFIAIVCGAEPVKQKDVSAKPDILFEDFEKDSYEGWTVDGKAFGKEPIEITDIPDYQGDVGGKGKRVVNSHSSAPGNTVGEKDSQTGMLTSSPFKIQRNYIAFLIGGGSHKGRTCVNLLINNKIAASVTGKNNNRMEHTVFDVRKHEGKIAKLQILDNHSSGWGNVGIDEIVFTDRKPLGRKLQAQRDYGTMILSLLGHTADDFSTASESSVTFQKRATADLGEKLVGKIGRKIKLAPGQSKTASFIIAWHFPNFYARDMAGHLVGHWYAAKFNSAQDVARYIVSNFERLTEQTRSWVRTWYDSTLPYWLLDRTMASTSHLATTTCYRFKDGRFWAWEGIGCCGGTCTHVWHYAQALGRLFPEIERDQRRRVDFGIALNDQGGIAHRMWINRSSHPAHDGQCGRILGAYREHQMSPDMSFLRETWPRIKKAIEYLIRLDKNNDGLIEGAQPNTLDAAWYGKISFLQSLYLAALKAGEAMAGEMEDQAFAERCRRIAERGSKTIEQLFNGEYFVQLEDPQNKDKIGVGLGCYIDQIYGQSWAHQVSLGRLFDKEKQLSALKSLWKYNFVPDVGPFRERFKRGRWYAIAGDAGMLMCTWPKGGQNPDFEKHWQYMYFNECMTGFEWQVASHMLSEGMLKEGLAVARAIHDRYNAMLRNPYNEIECSDHYARAMASYGAFISVCGFEHHGPKRYIGFAPRLSPENFKAAFTAAEGWGTFTQRRNADSQKAQIEIKWGALKLKTLALELPDKAEPRKVKVSAAGRSVTEGFERKGKRIKIKFGAEITLNTEEKLTVDIDYVRK